MIENCVTVMNIKNVSKRAQLTLPTLSNDRYSCLDMVEDVLM